MDEPPKLKRPIGVTILAILFILSGVISMASILGYGIGVPLFLEDLPEMSIEEAGFAVYFVAGGIIAIAVGGAMLSGKRWAWPAVIIMIIVELVLSVIFEVLGVGTAFWTIVLSVIVLLYMRKSNVKAYFGRIKEEN